MSGQISGYVTVTDFVKTLRQKFDEEKTPAELQDEKILAIDAMQTDATLSRRKNEKPQNEKYGVDVIV